MLCKYFHEDFMVNPVKIFCYIQLQHIPLFGAPGYLADPCLKLRPRRRGSLAVSASVTMRDILPVKQWIQFLIESPLHDAIRILQRHDDPRLRLIDFLHPVFSYMIG